MLKNYFAFKIQQFYKKFIKCDRAIDSFCKIKGYPKKIRCPIDPLYKIPYKEINRIKIIEYDRKYNIYNVWNFNIISIIDWLNKNKKWVNPLTNCRFKVKSQFHIINFIKNNSIKRKLYISPYIKKFKPILTNQNDSISILVNYVKNNDIKNCIKFFEKNKNINLNLDLEEYITIENNIITPIGFLHLIIKLGYKDLLLIFLKNGCNVDKKSGPGGYTPLHICALMNNLEMAFILLQFGAEIENYCYYKSNIYSLIDLCILIKNYKFLQDVLDYHD